MRPTTRTLALLTLPLLAVACDPAGPTSPELAPVLDVPVHHAPAAGHASGSTLLDFEELAADELQCFLVYERSGYEIRSSIPPRVDPPCILASAASSDAGTYAGSKALFLNYIGGGEYAFLTRPDGSSFDLASVSVAPVISFRPQAEVTLEGIRRDGSTVEETVSVSGFAFSAFTLSGFTDLMEVRIPQGAFFQGEGLIQFDDLALTLNFPGSKDVCREARGAFGFRNQGQCVRAVETGKDSRDR